MNEIRTTSRTAVGNYQKCPRLRYHANESPNGHEGELYCKKCNIYHPVPSLKECPECNGKLSVIAAGWESRKLAIPLVTGIYVHEGLAKALSGEAPQAAAQAARLAYLTEVESRGLAIEAGDEKEVIDEQAAHVEALVLAWSRVRLPHWQEEFEVVSVEEEDRVALADDVVLAVRADAIVRRKADRRMFVVNFKTAGTCDERWMRQWETDMQLMTELLAAEARYGEAFGGVIIEGLVKGQRVAVDQWLKEVRGDDSKDKVHSYIDRSRLLYGYKFDGDPPLQPRQYDWAGTTRKGWYKFRTWKENFSVAGYQGIDSSPLVYWINWLPEEVVEQQFAVVPPILRDASRIESCVRQIVGIEHRIADGNRWLGWRTTKNGEHDASWDGLLDEHFPQNGHSCNYPGRCAMYDMCWSPGIDSDPTSLYQPRIDHHQEVKP